MTRTVFNSALPALACILLAGCGAQLVVHQLDSSEPKAVVSIDGEVVGVVEYGDTLKVPLKRGPRRIVASVPDEERHPWSAPDSEWVVIVENDVILTLLPPRPTHRPGSGHSNTKWPKGVTWPKTDPAGSTPPPP